MPSSPDTTPTDGDLNAADGSSPAGRTVILTVSSGDAELFAVSLSPRGDVEPIWGNSAWCDFDSVLAAPDGRPLTRAKPLEWAMALQAAYADSPLSVWVSTGMGAPPAGFGSGQAPTGASSTAAGPGSTPPRTAATPLNRDSAAPVNRGSATGVASGAAKSGTPEPGDRPAEAETATRRPAPSPTATPGRKNPAAPPGARPTAPRDPRPRRGVRRARRRRLPALGALACVLLALAAVGIVGPHAVADGVKNLVGGSTPGCNVVNCTKAGQAPELGPVPGLATAARRGVGELMSSDASSPVSRDPTTGLWGSHTKPAWWQSGLALGTVARYALVARATDPSYQAVLLSTFRLNVRKPGTHMPLNFGNQFMDDTGWWGLSWLEAARYEASVLHNPLEAQRFLTTAEWDANYIYTRPRTCGGGLAWRLGAPPDTITMAEFVSLAAQLYAVRAAPGPFHDDAKAARWLAQATSALNWTETSGLVNVNTGAVNDTLDKSCQPTGGPLTYTEGEMADALTQMGSALHEPSYLRQASRFLAYTLNPRHGMMHDGVLQEFCESMASQCVSIEDFNVSVFKGMFVQAVADYQLASGDMRYRAFLRRQGQAIIANSVSNANGVRTSCQTDRDCQFGFYWARAIDPGKARVPVTVATQISALRALTADLAVSPGAGPVIGAL